MRRRMLIVGLVLVVGTALIAQGCCCPTIPSFKSTVGSGDVITEERSVSDINAVDISCSGTLYIEMGEEEELRVEAEDNIIDSFETKIEDGTLKIKRKSGVMLSLTKPVTFYLTVTELDSIKSSGSADIKAPDISVERFDINMSGSGNLDVKGLAIEELGVKISGSGKVTIKDGLGKKQSVKITGSGSYMAKDLLTNEAEVEVTGSGGATVHVTNELEVVISGSGDVKYDGSPTIDQNITGSGKLEGLDD